MSQQCTAPVTSRGIAIVYLRCPNCEKRFVKPRYYVTGVRKRDGEDARVFCSRTCAFGFRRGQDLGGESPVTLTCDTCGGSFSRPATMVRFAARKGRPVRYCSNRCRNKGHKNDRYAERITRVCKICGKPFTRRKSAIEQDERRGRAVIYCSTKCVGASVHTWTSPPNFRSGYRTDLGHMCRSTWEANVCRVLKAMAVPYVYEPRTFRLSDTHYTPDLLVCGAFWIEIKGWMKPKSRSKIAEFRTAYPSERLIIVDKPIYRAIEREWARRIPEWEFPKGKAA